MAIRIITDSICDVPGELADLYGMKVMPLTVHFGGESYKDGIELTTEEFLEKLRSSDVLPTTSQVPPGDFYDVFKEEVSKGNEVIAILGSSKLSGTYNSAVMAREQLGSGAVHVIDSSCITFGAGLLVIKAARLCEAGMKSGEIVREVEESKLRVKHLIILDTLKYLQKGGRLSLSASVLGSILNIKPILTVKDGKVEMLDKARGIKRAMSLILEMIEDNGWTLDGKVIGMNQLAAEESLKAFEEEIRSRYKVGEIIKSRVGSVVGAHAGPGAVALYFEV